MRVTDRQCWSKWIRLSPAVSTNCIHPDLCRIRKSWIRPDHLSWIQEVHRISGRIRMWIRCISRFYCKFFHTHYTRHVYLLTYSLTHSLMQVRANITVFGVYCLGLGLEPRCLGHGRSHSRAANMFPAGWTQMRLAWECVERVVTAAAALVCVSEFGALNNFSAATDVNSARNLAHTIFELLAPLCVLGMLKHTYFL